MLLRVIAGLVLSVVTMASPAFAGPALLFAPNSSTVFYSEDPDLLWFPASLTKLMTAYIAFKALKIRELSPDTELKCSEHASKQPPTKLGLPPGGELTVELGLKILIVKSANDVAVMLAEAMAGSEHAFVVRMNEEAMRLGMSRTHFVNANGLPDERQVTTARDLAKLVRAILIEFPERADLFALTEVPMGNKVVHGHNDLLVSFEGADGMKTGFICNSGYNIVASATRDGRKLVAIVLGELSISARHERAASLLENGFKRYFWKSLFGTSLDGLAFQASMAASPTHMHPPVCGESIRHVGRTRPSGAKPTSKVRALNASTSVLTPLQ